MGLIISVISPLLLLPCPGLGGAAGSGRDAVLPTAPFSFSPILAYEPLPAPRQLLTAPFCQGGQIGQISVMLKNWPISWQGTLTGGESSVHHCHRCGGACREGAPGFPGGASNAQGMGGSQGMCACGQGPTLCQTCRQRLSASPHINPTHPERLAL